MCLYEKLQCFQYNYNFFEPVEQGFEQMNLLLCYALLQCICTGSPQKVIFLQHGYKIKNVLLLHHQVGKTCKITA